MSKPDFSVQPRMTPRQAVYVLALIQRRESAGELHARHESVYNGAEARIRSALMDAGWESDGRGWTKTR